MKRLITADAYEWVKERAEHLMDVTDMEESECYGVAWKQYKKKYPSWKGKMQKQKMKKKKKRKIGEYNIKRLIKKSEFLHCHNCGFDNGDYMYDEEGNLLSWVPDTKTKKFKRLREKQIYKSPKDYEEKNPEHKCPICGEQTLDTD